MPENRYANERLTRARNASLELFRLVMMFGICLLHAQNSGYANRYMTNFLAPCTIGFVFISGWFGVRFSWRKILALYGVAFYAGVVYAAFDWWMSGVWKAGAFWAVFRGSWFLNAYVVMMLFAPIMNFVIEKANWRLLVPFLVLVYVWGFSTTVPILDKYVPPLKELHKFSGIALVGAYVAARLIRKYDLERFLTGARVWVLFIFISVCTSVGAADYNSPFCLLQAMTMFLIFKRMPECVLPVVVKKLILLASPSLFFVYLVHSHQGMFGYFRRFGDWVFASYGISPLSFYFVLAAFVLVVSVVIDLPRRGCVRGLRRLYEVIDGGSGVTAH